MANRPPDVRFEFDNAPEAPREARRALASLLSDPNDPIADAVKLTASELVTNVVRHTTSSGLMQAWDPRPDVPLRVEVEDHDRKQPAIPQNPAVGGHGLSIVATVADDWGVEPTVDGKVVWAEFNRPTDR
jgi:anti-sigma regulatory factor (Ser/Thr protein kinase)